MDGGKREGKGTWPALYLKLQAERRPCMLLSTSLVSPLNASLFCRCLFFCSLPPLPSPFSPSQAVLSTVASHEWMAEASLL